MQKVYWAKQKWKEWTLPCHETLHCHFAACAVLLWKRPGPTRVSIIDTLALRARDSREFSRDYQNLPGFPGISRDISEFP